MSLRVLHILDHSSPLHSGYVFRTLAILREQRRIGGETFHLTSPKQTDARKPVEEVDGWSFFRTLPPLPRTPLPLVSEWRLVRALERRIAEIAADVKPDILHAHSPVLNAIPALRVGARMGLPVVYEVRAFWEDAAVDHGTARENGLRYRATRRVETGPLAPAITSAGISSCAMSAVRAGSPSRATKSSLTLAMPLVKRWRSTSDSASKAPARFQ